MLVIKAAFIPRLERRTIAVGAMRVVTTSGISRTSRSVFEFLCNSL